VNWTGQYQAYISTSQIIANGIITASSAVDADLGETANVDQYDNLNIVEQGTASAISLNNQSSQPWSYSSGVLVDLTGAPGNPASRTVMFDLNDGWSWGGAPWGTPIQAQEDLIPILISPGS
jgi:hypothetical protein